MLVLYIVGVFNNTTLEFGTFMVVVGMIKVVLGVVILFELLRVDIRVKLKMLETSAVVVANETGFWYIVSVWDTNTFFEEFIS